LKIPYILREGNMFRKSLFFLFVLVLMSALASSTFRAEVRDEKSLSDEEDRVANAIEVIEEMVDIPEEGIPEALLSKAYGIAVIPKVIKAAWVVGGRYGKGVLLVRKDTGKWSQPCFIRIAGGSVGWQIGVQSADIILVFKRRKSVDSITEGKITLGADAGVAAGPVGRRAEASTDIALEAEIYSYSKSRGLFAGVSIEGAAIQIDEESNSNFYRRDYVSPRDILYGKRRIPAPSIAEKLQKILTEYTSTYL
jgi:lipid-binding SYLF domain-containing protein